MDRITRIYIRTVDLLVHIVFLFISKKYNNKQIQSSPLIGLHILYLLSKSACNALQYRLIVALEIECSASGTVFRDASID
jgi:hypothetical protein